MTTVQRLSRLWTEPVAEGADAIAAFGELYTDPVFINGDQTPLVDLVERARAMQRAFSDLSMEIIDEMEAPGRSCSCSCSAAATLARWHSRGGRSRSPVVDSR
ncbi:MAG: hypothetical protein ACTHQQ_01125 [Solirubrobacteraceae bacterium]